MNVQFYGLLYLSENESNGHNLSADSFSELKNFYLRNAVTLSISLKSKGISFVLLTNRAEEIQSDVNLLGMGDWIKVEGIPFHQLVPSGTKYYSAHFKLDVFNYFSSFSEKSYLGLLDLDMISISEIPQCLINIVEAGIPLCYDISDQIIPAFGHDVILQDIECLLGTTSEGRWSGGEFISGTPDFFRRFSTEANKICTQDAENPSNFHHQGDEMITSVALERLRRQGCYIADAGTLGIVGRFWSVPTLHPQKPFDYFRNCFLLHLPADKQFLAETSVVTAQQQDLFLKRYEVHLRAKELERSPAFSDRIKRKINHYLHA
jgi:hypothetical protein